MPGPSSSTDTNSILEVSFKDLLDKMLTYFEKFIKTPDELAALENKLNDYHNLLELVEITKDVFASLTQTIDEKLLSSQGDEDYGELEKVVQKHEGEIRNHIRIEQQLKLYSESIQAKLDDSEKGKTEIFEETKSIINNLKKENEKLVDSLKQKSTEHDTLNNLLKKLQDENKQYKEKLQELPFLQERIINLEKQTKAQTSSRPFIALKDASPYNQDNENLKKLDLDMEFSKINAKPDSTRKSVKSITTNQQQNSPLKFINKTTSGTSVQSNKNKDYIKVKVDVNDGKHRKELEALKSSYQKFYNPIKAQPKERTERARHATSVNKTRELKSIYSIPLVTHSSNTSLIHGAQQMSSHREQPLSKIHQRSSSYGGSRSKSRASIGRIDDNL